ncbi:MAG: J domain-containing protein [Planctomycetes bacterium]|nr:J domain-containing protein [Planctomycetota bacterium]
MPVRRAVDTNRTLADLRDTFRRWEVELWEAIPDPKTANGIAVRYFRAEQWQQVSCLTFPRRADNLRQCFLLLDRLRIAEQHGVSYTGLTSTTELARATPEVHRQEALLEAYGILGAAPDDPIELVKIIYKRKAMYFHPDKGGDAKKMQRLQKAYETVCANRGEKP